MNSNFFNCSLNLVLYLIFTGTDKPRLTAFESQSLLPSAREVSLSVHLVRDNKTGEHSHLLMGYGQLLDHDFTLTAEAVDDNGEEIER